MIKKLKKIPKFKNLDEEQKFWAAHDSTDYIDYSKVELGFFPELKPSSKTISIRLPESLLEAVKILATTPTRTKIGARMNPSHLRRVRKERRKNKGRGVPLDSSLLMGDALVWEAIRQAEAKAGTATR